MLSIFHRLRDGDDGLPIQDIAREMDECQDTITPDMLNIGDKWVLSSVLPFVQVETFNRLPVSIEDRWALFCAKRDERYLGYLMFHHWASHILSHMRDCVSPLILLRAIARMSTCVLRRLTLDGEALRLRELYVPFRRGLSTDMGMEDIVLFVRVGGLISTDKALRMCPPEDRVELVRRLRAVDLHYRYIMTPQGVYWGCTEEVRRAILWRLCVELEVFEFDLPSPYLLSRYRATRLAGAAFKRAIHACEELNRLSGWLGEKVDETGMVPEGGRLVSEEWWEGAFRVFDDAILELRTVARDMGKEFYGVYRGDEVVGAQSIYWCDHQGDCRLDADVYAFIVKPLREFLDGAAVQASTLLDNMERAHACLDVSLGVKRSIDHLKATYT